MQTVLQKYLVAFKKLRVDRAHGVAPHKPVLLISILQSIRRGDIDSNRVYITPELVALFKTNWSLLVTATNFDCRFALPFYYLTRDQFWKLVPKPGFESILSISAPLRSFANLNAAIDCAVVAEDLLLLMRDENSNEVLTQFLLDHYFPNRTADFDSSLNRPDKTFEGIERKLLSEPAEQYRAEIKQLMEAKNEEEVFLRGSIFKREIPKIYNNTCCISGMRIDAVGSVSMIDACHIMPFSVSYDDTVRNGIALCPNLHRAFDRGLIGIDEDYRVVVSAAFKEVDSSYGIRILAGKKIMLPNDEAYRPRTMNFEWHRKYIFKA